MNTALVRFDRATLTRPAGDVVFRDVSWSLNEGETWAVVGVVGSGKSSLAEAVLGRLHVDAGEVSWPLLDRLASRGRTVNWPSEVIHRLAFKEESRLFTYSRYYYQQRFNFIEPSDDLMLADFLCARSSASDEEVRDVARQLGVEEQLPLSFIKLSNGQARRARIAKALLAEPELLILDDPFMGLDAAGRDDVSRLLGALVRAGRRLLLIARADALPEWITHVLKLERMSVTFCGTRAAFARMTPQAETPSTEYSVLSTPPPELIDEREIRLQRNRVLLELRHVTVSYDERPILNDVSWTVRAGERWAVLGPNGSGKTTLLSLLCGDHPQAYSNEIYLFGQRRGSGESIWDIKRRVGLVSSELHFYFTEPLTAAQTAATGFFDVLVRRPTTPEQDTVVEGLFEHFGLTHLSGRPFARLSTGEQRLVLLVRALVKRPALLILDEPFQGLDRQTMERARGWFGSNLGEDQSLIFVSHHEDEIPNTVDRFLRLELGSVAASSR